MKYSGILRSLCLIAVLWAMGISAPAAAQQLMPGCDPRVWNAQVAKAKAKVARAAGVAGDIIEKPNSVLELTCFDKAVGQAAVTAGQIFSGDMTQDANSVIGQSYDEFVSDNFDGTDLESLYPGDSQNFDVGATYDCEKMEQAFESEMESVEQDVPYETDNELEAGAIAGAGQNTLAILGRSAASSVYAAAKAALPTAIVPSYLGARSFCQVLAASGMGGSCP